MISALFLLGVMAAFAWYQRTDPLVDNGLTIYTDPVDKYKVFTIEVVNRGRTAIDIESVTVNGKRKPDLAQLGITYDSGHLVQYMGDQTDPATKFMNLHDASIFPQLSDEKIQALLASKPNSNKPTPVHYGIIVRYDQEPLQDVTIRYTYLGFTKVKRVTKWSFDYE